MKFPHHMIFFSQADYLFGTPDLVCKHYSGSCVDTTLDNKFNFQANIVGFKAENLRATERCLINEFKQQGILVETSYDLFHLKVNPPSDYLRTFHQQDHPSTSVVLKGARKEITSVGANIVSTLMAKTLFNYGMCFKHHHEKSGTSNSHFKRVFLEPFVN